MIYGYGRISHRDQKLDAQVLELEKYGVDEIVTETITGVAEEKELNRLLNKMTAGDTLVATRMDRLGRNARQLLILVDDLQAKGIRLVLLDLGVDTSTPTGRFFLQVMAAFAELERVNNKEKQMKGIEVAKEKGVYKGRPVKFGERNPKMKHALELVEKEEHTLNEICKITGISRTTLYRRLKELEEKQ
jgi:DNA invertase Pin-like site-specific DNA recombinase